jgi:hypothetical protein
MRFAAFRSLEAGADELAVQFLNSLRNKELNDYIAGAFAMVQLGRLDDAENILKFTSESSWSYVAIEDVVLIQALLDEISSQRPLKTITPGFVEYVQQTLDQYKLADSAHSFEHDGFCVSLGT